MRDIKDYLHLYLGCDIMHGDGTTAKLVNVGFVCGFIHNIHNQYGELSAEQIKPILRKLPSMTEEEFYEMDKQGDILFESFKRNMEIGYPSLLPDEFTWLLSKHFDLFGLIESGLAIDKDTLKD